MKYRPISVVLDLIDSIIDLSFVYYLIDDNIEKKILDLFWFT